MPLTRLLRTIALVAAFSATLAGCALGPYSPSGVPAGASCEEILRVMGPPTAAYGMPDGHERLEYTRQPAGRHTFMVDLDAGGRLAHWENVLDEQHFAAIVPGMRAPDVLRLIGPPSFTARYARPSPGTTWNYRFETIQRCIVFQVDFNDATGQVLESAYPSDPGCPDEYL